MINRVFVNDKPLNGELGYLDNYDSNVIPLNIKCSSYSMDYAGDSTHSTTFDELVELYYDPVNGKLIFKHDYRLLCYDVFSNIICIQTDRNNPDNINIIIVPNPDGYIDIIDNDAKFPIHDSSITEYLYISDQIPPIKAKYIDSNKKDEIISKISLLLTPGKIFKYYDTLYSVNGINYLKGEIYASVLSNNYGTVQTATLDISNTNWDHITLDEISDEPVIFWHDNQSLGYGNPLAFPPVLLSYNSYRTKYFVYELLKVGAYIRNINITHNDNSQDVFKNIKFTKVYLDKTNNKLIFGTDNLTSGDEVCISIDIRDHVVVMDEKYYLNDDSKYMEYVDFDIHLIKKESKKFPYITETIDIKNNCLISYLFIDYDHPPMLVDTNITAKEVDRLEKLMRMSIIENFKYNDHNCKMIEKFYMDGNFLIEDIDDNLNRKLLSYKDLVTGEIIVTYNEEG